MVTAVVMFSGGVASWMAARRIVDEGGDPVLLFTDTLIEDPDLYRFLDDAATDLGVEGDPHRGRSHTRGKCSRTYGYLG